MESVYAQRPAGETVPHGQGRVPAISGRRGGVPAPQPGSHWLNAERVRVYSWMVVVIFGIGAAIWTALSLPDLVDPNGKPVGYDFIAFWSAARLALEGRPEAAYDWTAILAAHQVAVPAMKPLVFAWHYPPTFLLAVLPLGLLAYPAALVAFTLAGAGLWAALVRRLTADRRVWIVAAACPAGLISLLDGQNGFLTAGLAGFALLMLQARRPVPAGVLIGLLAIKPHLAVLFPIALLADRQWRAIAAAFVTAALLAAAGVAAFGWGTLEAFLHDLPASRALIDGGSVPWSGMPSPYVFALSLGVPVAGAIVLQAAVALFAAACVYRAWRRPEAPFEARAAVLTAGAMLVSPFLFSYDLTWAALAVGWLALLGLRTGFRRWEREVLLFAWLSPVAMAPVQALTHVQIGFPASLLLLLLAVYRAAPFTDAEWQWLHRAFGALREARWVTRERLMRWGVGFLVMSLALIAVHVVTHTRVGLTNGEGVNLGDDFIHFWSGAHMAAAGQASLASDARWFHAFEAAATGAGAVFGYGYPPIAMLLSLPLALFSFVPGLIVWTLAGIGLCFALLRHLAGWRAAALLAVGAPAAFFNLNTGQNGYFTAALLAGGMMILDRRPVLAGICFGCLSYKPHMGVLLPIALAVGGYWRCFAAAAVTVLLLGLATVAVLGPETWAGFLGMAPVHRSQLEYGIRFWHRMPTAFAAARVLGAPVSLAYAAQLVSCILAVASIVFIWRLSAPLLTKAAGLIVATFLATPYAWDYDGVVLIFAAAWIGREGLRTGFLTWERIAIVALLVLPLVAMVTTKLAGLQVGPVVLWLVLLLLLRRSVLYRYASVSERMSGPIPIGDVAAG
jgi:hypothetical protein